jgi:hypothetical protein
MDTLRNDSHVRYVQDDQHTPCNGIYTYPPPSFSFTLPWLSATIPGALVPRFDVGSGAWGLQVTGTQGGLSTSRLVVCAGLHAQDERCGGHG